MKSKSKSRSGKEYSAHEMRVMRSCARRRMSARATAARLGRSPGAVRYKAMVEGVHFRSFNQKPGMQSRPAQRRKLSRIAKARAA